MGNEVKVAGRIGMVEVRRRRKDPLLHRLQAEDRFHGSGRPQHVAGHGLRRADREPSAVFAEDGLDGLHLILIVQGGGCPVGVDVIDLRRFHSGLLKGGLHAPGGAFVARRRRRHVKGVAGHAVAGNLPVDSGPPVQGKGQFLQNEGAAALADHKPVPLPVEGTAGPLRFFVSKGQCPHGVEAAHAEGAYGGVDPAGDHHVGIAVGDRAKGVPDGVRAGRAGGHGTVDRPLGLKADRHEARGEIGQRRGNREGGHPLRSVAKQDDLRFLQRAQPADGGADDDARASGKGRIDGQRRVGHRHVGGNDGIDEKLVETADFLLVQMGQRIEILQLSGNPGLEAGRVESRDAADAGPAAADTLPGFSDRVSQRRQRADPGDDHPSFQTASLQPDFSTECPCSSGSRPHPEWCGSSPARCPQFPRRSFPPSP